MSWALVLSSRCHPPAPLEPPLNNEPTDELPLEEPLVDEPLVDELLVLLAPESLTDEATSTPWEFLTPWMTTLSPGRTDFLDTERLLVSLVAEDSLTLTVFPELSFKYNARPLTLLIVPTDPFAPPGPPPGRPPAPADPVTPRVAVRAPDPPPADNAGSVALALEVRTCPFSIWTPA